MKKIIILGLVLLMVVVFGTVALAEADVQKLVLLTSDTTYQYASGMAIVNYPEEDVALVITVSVKGLIPETEYEVKGCWGYVSIGFFTTNKNGNGHFHRNYRVGEVLPTTEHIYIYRGGNILIDEDYPFLP